MILLKLFNRRWWWTTLLVIAGVALFVRLGFWQFDRLDQRRAFNSRVATRWQQEPFDLNSNSLPANLDELEYRRVQIEGELDYTQQIVLRNQTRNDAPGVFLITPLKMDDGRAVLVARGWVPIQQAAPEYWPQFEEPSHAPVVGLIQESQTVEGVEPPAAPQTEWFRVDIDAIQRQMPYDLLPIFILQLPEDGRSYSALPFREEPLVLSEGNHFSYAIQWFCFAVVLGVGYVILIKQEEVRAQRLASGELGFDVEDASEAERSAVETPAFPHQERHA